MNAILPLYLLPYLMRQTVAEFNITEPYIMAGLGTSGECLDTGYCLDAVYRIPSGSTGCINFVRRA